MYLKKINYLYAFEGKIIFFKGERGKGKAKKEEKRKSKPMKVCSI